nr:tRNA lysidine(34) synthetase TilS [Puniceibacterium sp. IMCC21224]
MGSLLGPDFPTDIGLAVSGGGDSMAMLTLAHNWSRVWGVRLWVVTVDHGLRPEAASEAAMVAAECGELGWPHATLRWHWDGQGNVQDAARRARLNLIDRWRNGIAHVLMAHTRDDLAETFLMRLGRGSGVDGLSAMQARRFVGSEPGSGVELLPEDVTQTHMPPDGAYPAERAENRNGFQVIRPCLDMRRAELRHYLTTLKGRWVEDPSNDDRGYDRVRMRQLLQNLDAEGLGAEVLSATATRLARARPALRARAAQVWTEIGTSVCAGNTPLGDLQLDRDGLAKVEADTRLRLLAAALQYISTNSYRPRVEALEALLDKVQSGGAGTLHGCEIRANGAAIRVTREPRAVAAQRAVVGDGTLWDRRWKFFHNDFIGLTIRSLGEDGWGQCQEHNSNTPAFRYARALPSVWDGDRLVACDAMAVGPGQTTTLWPMGRQNEGFHAFLLSH